MTITRFAPSPTGYLHIGGLRTALYCYLVSKNKNGKFLLRIEDTDLARNSKEAAAAIEEAFEWTGLSYDGEVVYQSNRFDLYKSYVQKLLDEGKAYRCYMSKEELDAMRAEQTAAKQRPHYDGRYRDFTGEPPAGVEPVIRIKAPREGEISFVDGVKGEVHFNVSDMLDDFIIARSDGTPTYNFVVTIDDALMEITDVIRGDDHLSNTPKQIVIYNALGFKIPKFYHVPMILNHQGKKLSKRDGALDVMEYKRAGYLPEALLNFLVRLGWSHGDQEIFSLEEMIQFFDPNHINKSASAFNEEKLVWINAQYIKQLDADRLIKELEYFNLSLADHPKAHELIDLLRDRAKTLVELADMARAIINAPTDYDAKAYKKFIKGDALENLKAFKQTLEAHESCSSAEAFEVLAKQFLEEKGLKLKDLAQPLRIAMVGGAVSPSVFGVLSIIGHQNVIARIERLLNHKGKNDE
ncbi:glutamate--tRNA ligase [Sulfurospirillum sp. 1612]|uniref:glutamate--tRNA ligase n=1 Tax=Sulfurospirillum sp. 1612 TaxID=3094835 RepID=UPI002F949402